jgi:hypothetical protein
MSRPVTAPETELLAAGFPCIDVSQAGLGRASEERYVLSGPIAPMPVAHFSPTRLM